MKLESVRDLKAELTAGLSDDSVVESFAALGAMKGAGPGVATRRRSPQIPLPEGVVLGVSPGHGGNNDRHKLAIRFQKQTEEAVRFGHYVAGKLGSEIDIQFVGAIQAVRKLPPKSKFHGKVRPLQNGYSVGHVLVTAGTLGGFVKGLKEGQYGILSNNHVLGAINKAKKGDDIVQPGPADQPGQRSKKDSRIGSFQRFVKLKPFGNEVDAAWALVDAQFVDPRLVGEYAGKRRGSLVAAADIVKSQKVWKVGRTTGITRGRVSAIELDAVKVGYPGLGDITFNQQIEIVGDPGAFSLPGDSGSIVFDEAEARPMALLFSGSKTGGPKRSGRTYASPLETVLNKLGLELA